MKTFRNFLILFLTLSVINFAVCQETPVKDEISTKEQNPVKRQSEGETTETDLFPPVPFYRRFLNEFAKFRHGIADGWSGGASGRVFATGEEQSLSYRVGKRVASIMKTVYTTSGQFISGLASRSSTSTTDQN